MLLRIVIHKVAENNIHRLSWTYTTYCRRY